MSRGYKIAYTGAFGALIVTYLLLAFLPAPNKATLHLYHLTATSYHWIILPLVLIIVLIWLAGLYGSLNVKEYSSLISRSRDGRAFNNLAAGFIVLSLGLPIGSVVGGVIGIVDRRHTSWLPTTIILDNYLNLLLMAAGMILVAVGAERLCGQIRTKVRPLPQWAWMLIFVVLSVMYSYFIVVQPIHTPLARRIYYLPNWLLLSTLAAPYLYIWYLGLHAAQNLYIYQKNVRGVLYKSALNYLAAGVTVVILSSILARSLITISANLAQLSLTPVLFIVYGLLIAQGAGYILIAVGAKRLRQIEEV